MMIRHARVIFSILLTLALLATGFAAAEISADDEPEWLRQ